MNCKICSSASVLIHSCHLTDPLFTKQCFYYECPNCEFCFTPSFDNLNTSDWTSFYKYPEYLSQDEWAYLEWVGKGPGRFDILLNSIRYAEELIDYKPNKIIIHGNGVSKALESLNTLREYSGKVFATYSSTGHPNELHKIEDIEKKSCDIIVSAEVFEHFCDPVSEFKLMKELIAPGGCIVGTTGSKEKYRELTPDNPYSYLINSPRNGHVAMYSKKSIEMIGSKLNMKNFSKFASEFGHDSRKWRIAFC